MELIAQLTAMGKKVLVAAPSNIAVDNLVERLAVYKPISVVRVGHPARLLASIQHLSLDARVDASDEAGLVRDIRKEMDTITVQMLAKRRDARSGLRSELKVLRKELRMREKAAVKEALRSAKVVLGTLTSVAHDGPLGLLPEGHFDVCVIDEAGQSLEVACWTALLNAPCCVLAGDHLQLPPTITSKPAATKGLAITLLERAVDIIGNDNVKLLDTQYRMNKAIMQWSSDSFYEGRLIAADVVKDHTLSDLEHVTPGADAIAPVVFIDTAGLFAHPGVGHRQRLVRRRILWV